MANQKYFVVWGLLIFLQLQNNVSGEITAEAVYTLLSHSIFEMKTDMEIIKRRIEKVEEKTQGMFTTVSPQLTGSVITENEEMNFKEDITMQALAIQKTLSAEKLLLRDAVENFELKFADFKSEIQKDIALINGSLEGKAEVMLDIVNQSSITLENGIAQLTSDLNHTTNNLSQFLETMQTTMMSNFEDIETRMIANVTMLEREVYDMANSSAQELATGIGKLRSDWNSTTNNISEILKTSERTMQSYMKEIEKKITDDVARKQSATQTSLNSLQTSLNSLSSTVSSISYTQTNTIQPELKSLSSRITSVSSSLSSTSSSLSSQISSLSDRIYEEEKTKVSFLAQMTQPDSYYNQAEVINDFNNVARNHGNGFDSSTGIFTAPRSGTYLVSLQIAATNDDILVVDLKFQNGHLGSALAKGYLSAGSATFPIYLSTGDRVWAQTNSMGTVKKYIKSHYTWFSGVLID